jgi:hypothetical protein
VISWWFALTAITIDMMATSSVSHVASSIRLSRFRMRPAASASPGAAR